MSENVGYLLCALLIGAGATVVMDFWAVVRKRLLSIPPLDYGLVGRWLAYLPRGRFRHNPIAASKPVHGERVIGWIAHYLIGIAFAGVLLAIWGLDWVRHPTIGPALIVGIGSVAAPLLLMQPGMGAGIAASRTPRPAVARFHGVVTHGCLGLVFMRLVGLWVCWSGFNRGSPSPFGRRWRAAPDEGDRSDAS